MFQFVKFVGVIFKTRETLIEAANLYTIKIGLVCCLDVINVRNGTVACSPKKELYWNHPLNST